MQLFFASGELLRNENQIILTSQLQTNSTTPHSPWYVFLLLSLPSTLASVLQSSILSTQPPLTHPSPPIVSAVQALSFIFVAKFSESRGPCKNHFCLSIKRHTIRSLPSHTRALPLPSRCCTCSFNEDTTRN